MEEEDQPQHGMKSVIWMAASEMTEIYFSNIDQSKSFDNWNNSAIPAIIYQPIIGWLLYVVLSLWQTSKNYINNSDQFIIATLVLV